MSEVEKDILSLSKGGFFDLAQARSKTGGDIEMGRTVALLPFIGPLAGIIFAIAIIVVIGLITSSPTVRAASVSVTFDGALDIPHPATAVDAPAQQPDKPSEFLGREVASASTEVITPYSTVLSDDGKTITFIARDTDESRAAGFAQAAARRFVDRQDRLAIDASPIETYDTGARKSSGIATSTLAMTATIAGLAALAATTFAARIRRTALALHQTLSR